MNCKSCQQQLAAYIAGQVPDDVKEEVLTHLNHCNDCKQLYVINGITEKTIEEERAVKPNPFMASRIMAQLDSKHSNRIMRHNIQRVLKPVAIAASIIVAITVGIAVGNSYSKVAYTADIPQELIYLDDASMEAIPFLISE